jgi:hypothetical protein
MPARGLKKPEAVLHELDRAAAAVRRSEIQIAVHHVGNALLILKQALSPEPPKRRGKLIRAGRRRPGGGAAVVAVREAAGTKPVVRTR